VKIWSWGRNCTGYIMALTSAFAVLRLFHAVSLSTSPNIVIQMLPGKSPGCVLLPIERGM